MTEENSTTNFNVESNFNWSALHLYYGCPNQIQHFINLTRETINLTDDVEIIKALNEIDDFLREHFDSDAGRIMAGDED